MYYAKLYLLMLSSSHAGQEIQLAQDAGALHVSWGMSRTNFEWAWERVCHCGIAEAVSLHFDYNISVDRLRQIDDVEQGTVILGKMAVRGDEDDD